MSCTTVFETGLLGHGPRLARNILRHTSPGHDYIVHQWTQIKQTTINPANNGYLTGTDLPTERLYDSVKNTKKQNTTYDENYVGVGGTTVSQPINEEQYNNAETNATKEIIAQGRYPSPEGDKYYNSKETYNIEIKKNEQDYFNHRQTHYDRGNTEYLAKNTCNFTQFKNKLNDTSIGSIQV